MTTATAAPAASSSAFTAPTAVSFLPSATEIVYTLGLDDQLLGRTFECDYPPEAAAKQVLLDTKIPPNLTPGEIDAFVKSAGGSAGLFAVRDTVGDIDPDVILTQDLCGVCAVPASDVQAALDILDCQSKVVCLDPHTLDQIVEAVQDIAAALGAPERAIPVVTDFRRRLGAVRTAVAGRPRPTVVVLEWVDPPFGTGHWIPEMIDAAGGTPLLANHATPSVEVSWEQVAATEADIMVVTPCGFHLDDGLDQAREAVSRPELASLPALRNGRVYAIDATSVVTRPGPRVIDGVEAFASAFHPGAVAERNELIRPLEL